MAWTRTGLVSVTNGSIAVTGTGTAWITTAGIGEAIRLPDGRLYEIGNIVSDVSITLGSPYLGATQAGQPYEILPSQSYIRDLAARAAALVNEKTEALAEIAAALSAVAGHETAIAGLGSLSQQSAADVEITGGSVTNTPISGAPGSFTDLESTERATLNHATISGDMVAKKGVSTPFLINPASITEDITIPAGYNASSTGPLAIGDGITVTLEDNANWSIL